MSKSWFKAAGIRALKTMAQSAISVIGVSQALNEVDWLLVVSSVLIAGILSFLTSLAGLPEVSEEESEDYTDES
jgi:hypothetical protein